MKRIRPSRESFIFRVVVLIILSIFMLINAIRLSSITLFFLFIVFVIVAVLCFANVKGKYNFFSVDIEDDTEKSNVYNQKITEVESMGNNFCPYCGLKVNSDNLYCKNCGKKML